ncbi:MAG: hypothetical protein A2Y62_15035 [Candidatus Fischerbacteria bacterium RBG_13_37_8]|uniref:Band 7 domain-containing protein n=1 Tax=Candidatus Fischerbacteria bacterium RBG_13_37_8 TaxID=1817863 RepID=A0A1F5V4P0_9BACT|nr:MAG: hypothetical protein A2Y62_15035 [Candidatus Fischerbacteria bacterium RBG_13_37_8]
MGFLENWLIPGIIIVVFIAFFSLFRMIARNWIKVAPNEVAIVYGRKHKSIDGLIRGFRVITGGGFFKWPVIENVQRILLNIMAIPVEVKNVPDKMGALVTVQGITNVKIISSEESLPLAIERFLGMDMSQIQQVAKENLEGNLRAMVGTMTIEELIQDRQALQERILKEAVIDLAKLGLGVDLLTIQEMRDERGYIESLGKKRTAEVRRDAIIGEAEAKRDADIRSAEASRQGETAKAVAEQNISDAQRERDVIKAKNSAQVQSEQARIPIAAQIASAEEQKRLNITLVEAEKARTISETQRQAEEKKRHLAELDATIIVQADRDREAKIISADADQQAAVRTGEAKRILSEKEGQGVQAKLTAEAEGRKAAAVARQKELEAEAAGERAQLIAQAEGEKARLLAEAEGTKARLLAEAEGALKKAEAYKALDDAGRFLMIMQVSPDAIHAIGEVVKSFMEPTAQAIGSGLANVQEIRLIDFGNTQSGDGKNVLSQFVNMPAETIFNLIQKLKAAGLGPAFVEVMQKAGINLSSLLTDSPPVKDVIPDSKSITPKK